jgi:hypothetical protein
MLKTILYFLESLASGICLEAILMFCLPTL